MLKAGELEAHEDPSCFRQSRLPQICVRANVAWYFLQRSQCLEHRPHETASLEVEAIVDVDQDQAALFLCWTEKPGRS